MVFRKLICVLLTACLLVAFLFVTPVSCPPAKAEVLAIIGIAMAGFDLLKTGFNVIKFFTGNTPTQQAIDQINDQIKQLQAVISQEQEIDEEIQTITDELTFNSLLQEANKCIFSIKDLWGDANTQKGSPCLLGMAMEDYDTLHNNQGAMDDFTSHVMQKGSVTPSVEVGVEALHQALVIHPPGCPNNALEQARDIAIDWLNQGTTKSDFSTTVESTNGVGIVAERPMYFNYEDIWSGGHCAAGVPGPGTDFYFAEGTTRPGFHSYICVQNPEGRDASVKITYMRGDSSTEEQTLAVPAHTRSTVRVNDVLGSSESTSSDFSAKVESTNGVGIVAERPMYFNYKGAWTGGHCQAGATSPATTLYFAEGSTRPNFDSYICVQNPEGADASVKITYMRGDSSTEEQTLAVPAHTRSTVRVNDVLGSSESPSSDFSAKVESTNGVGIVAERPMYFNYKDTWSGGHCAAGVPGPGTDFYFAEGTTRPGFHSYICLENGQGADASVKITYMRGDSSTEEQTLAVPAHTRSTVRVNDVLGSSESTSSDFSAKVESTNGVGIVAERPMYFNYKDTWSGGHCDSGVSAPAAKFYFAEGTARPGFEPYFCIQNPEGRDAEVRITYMKGDGTTAEQSLTIPAHTRSTVAAADATKMTLLQAYEQTLGNLFVNCWIYQLMGTLEVCNAREYDPEKYGSSQDFLDKYYKPYVQEEAEMFLQCVEQLVMSQADTSQLDRKHPNIMVLPSDAAAVFEDADLACRMALGQGYGYNKDGTTDPPFQTVNYGLFGRIIASQDLVPAGSAPPKIQAWPQGGGQPYDTSTAENASVGWLSKSKTVQEYDCWTTDGSGQLNLSLSGDWSMIRFAFDNLPVGTYDIKDASGTTLAQGVKVTANTEPGSDYTLIYGSSPPITMMKGGPGFVLDQSRWTPATGHSGTNSEINDKVYKPHADAGTGSVGGMWFISDNPKGTYHFYPFSKLQFVDFVAAEDMDIDITYSFSLKVYDTSGDAKEKYDTPSDHPNGYVSCYRGYLSDSCTSQATYKFQFGTTDSVNNNKDECNIATDGLSASPIAGGYSMHDDWDYPSKTSQSSKQHLTAGTKYRFCVRVDADMSTKSAQAKSNFVINLDGLRILGQ